MRRQVFSLSLLSACLLFLCFAVLQAAAEQWIGPPMKDNTIYQGAQFEDNSCGAGSGMIAGRTN